MLATAGLIVLGLALASLPPTRSARQPSMGDEAFVMPGFKGLNYGVPLTQEGDWVGTGWLRSGPDSNDEWHRVRPRMIADLDFVQAHGLGHVIRLFIALDQLMRWDPKVGFLGFNETELANLDEALDIFDAHGSKVVGVLYDQEDQSSPGNFRFEALDGNHAAMRRGYLTATEVFLKRFGSRPTVVAWDLFNEAYASLGGSGHLLRPPAPDPVSPNYPDSVVHGFLSDLYATAKRVQPHAWFTVSDATLYWHNQPDLAPYRGILDFYDVHVYDDRPVLPDWATQMDRPYIIGEAGAAVEDEHFKDQRIEPAAIRSILEQARSAGVRCVLVHSIANQNVFSGSHDSLTPTGKVLAEFADSGRK
jgi:hypothetical protein